jgi:tetratricopeptide (TPR) repeat protein
MKKKQIEKGRKQPKSTARQPKPVEDKAASTKLKTWLASIIAIFAFILYAQSINHDYTLDDHRVIDENTVTKRGIAGIPDILKTDYWYGSGRDELRGPIYRPTSLIVFATVWEFSPDSPHLYHFINVVLYAVTCLILFLLLNKLFARQGLVFAFACTLLFVAHPIHTEVVNNIKSLDEILCLLFGIIAIWFAYKYSLSQSMRALVFGGISFFMSLLSKETGIAFLVIIPLSVFFLSANSKKPIITASITLVGITALWLLIRMAVLKDVPRDITTATSPLNNTLYAAPNMVRKYATAFYILIRYVFLLIFPHPLTSDYNFAQIKIQDLTDPGALIGIIFYFGIGIYAILNLRRKSIIAYGILFYLVALAPVSNIFFLGGSSMAERFLYTPSIGFCIVIAYFLARLTKTEVIKSRVNSPVTFFSTYSTLLLIVLGIAILYSFKTLSRNRDWKDTLTVFSRDVQTSKNSATANELFGNALLLKVAKSPNKQNQVDSFNLAKKYLKRALEIAPGFYYAASNLGYIYLAENKPDSGYPYLRDALKYGPRDIQVNYYYGSTLFLLNKLDSAIKILNHTVELNPKYEAAYSVLASAYLGKGDVNNGLASYLKVIELNPNNAKAYYYAAGLLRSKGDTVKANEYMNKAVSLGYSGQP